MFKRFTIWSLLPSDPGLLRTTAACRTTLTALIAALTMVPVLLYYEQSVFDVVPVILLTLLGMLFTRDRTLRARQLTLVMAFPVGALALAVASVIAQWTLAGMVGMVAMLGGSTLMQTRGPRVIVVTVFAVIGYYVGLFLHPGSTGLLWMLATLVPGLIFCLASLRIFPDHPDAVARRMLGSIARQAHRVVEEAEHPRRSSRRLERHLLQLNHSALAAEEQLALSDVKSSEAIITALVDLELAVTHAALTLGAEVTTWRGAVTELARSTMAIGRSSPRMGHARSPQPSSLAPLAWRPALRTCCAAAVAIAVGYPLSPEHWYWAVIGVFVTFLGTNSSGDTVQKGLLRLAGTAGGALAGLCVASLAQAHPASVMVAMTVCVFAWAFYVIQNYAVGIFFLTLLLGLVYGALGQSMPAIVWLRFEETVIGAAATFIMALWLLPLPTSSHVRARGLALIKRLEEVIEASCLALEDGASASPLAAMRKADRAFQDLRTAMSPLRAGLGLMARDNASKSLPTILVCVHWVRVLAVAIARAPSLPAEDRDAVLMRLERLRTHLASFTTTDRLPEARAVVSKDISPLAGSAALMAEAAEQLDDALSRFTMKVGLSPNEFATALLA